MRVALGKFVCSGIKAHLGEDIPAGVRTALFHYTGKLRTGRRPVSFPHFLAGSGPQDEPELAFDLIVDAETEAMLEREALRQRTTTGQLVAHSVLIYLAELEMVGAAPQRGDTANN